MKSSKRGTMLENSSLRDTHPYTSSAASSDGNPRLPFIMNWPIGRALLTAACSVGLTLAVWVLIVMLLDRRFRDYEKLLWSGSLWISAMACTGLVASSRHAVRPGLGCTIAFAVFGLAYMICEGPIFGVVSEGGDPSMTEFVVLNLGCLPCGVFAAAEIGRWAGHKRRHSSGP